MGPRGALDRGPSGPSEEPVESLASGLGLPPGLLRGLDHDAGHLWLPAVSTQPGQLLGLEHGLSPRQAVLGPRQGPRH